MGNRLGMLVSVLVVGFGCVLICFYEDTIGVAILFLGLTSLFVDQARREEQLKSRIHELEQQIDASSKD